MEDKILDCVNYIKNISKQKVTLERTFIYMIKNDESVSEAEIQETIATLISLNRLEEWEIGTKSYFIASLPYNILAPQTLDVVNQTSQKWKNQSLMIQTHRKMKIWMVC